MFDQLEFKPRKYLDGTQAKIFFDNGYGASIVTGGYGDTNQPYEVAVLKGTKDGSSLCYDTPITDDVIGHCDASRVEMLLEKIAALPQGEII